MTTNALQRFARAFRHSNFAIYTAGNSVNLIGFWMQRIAVGWVTWELTESGAWLGLMAFADLFPTVLISPIAGALADRTDRLRLAMTTQLLTLLQATLLAALALSGALTIEWLLALTLTQGVVFSFWQPVRLALVPSLVPRDDLASAVAVNSVIFNSARFLGPALAGAIIVAAAPGWAFAANALTGLALLAALQALRLPADAPAGQRRPEAFFGAIIAGYRYAANHPGIGTAFIVMLASCLCLRPVFELLPGFAAEVFARGAVGLSSLASATGLGAIVGGFWLGQRPSTRGLSRLMVDHLCLLSLSLLLFCATANFWLGLACIGLAGFATVVGGAGAQTLLQTRVDGALRGRVMALYGMTFRSGPALGALAMGALSESLGMRLPVLLGCVIALIVWYTIRRRLQRLASALEGT